MKKLVLSMLLYACFSTVLFSQTSMLYDWKSLPLGGGGFVSAVIAHPSAPNVIYARTDVGGAYRWEHTTKTWTPLTDWISSSEIGLWGIESLALDPNNPARVYMLAGISYFNSGKTAILISHDYGNSFQVVDVTSQFKAHGNGMGRQTGERLVVDPNNSNILFCGTRAHGLFKSINAGLSWSKVNSFPVSTTANENGICILTFDKTKLQNGVTQKIYAGVSRMGADNLFVSSDAGLTWNPVVNHPKATYMPHRMELASNGMLYITYGNGAGPHGQWNLASETMATGAVWRFNTVNETWKEITPNISSAYGGLAVDPTNPKKIIVTTINKYLQQPWGWGDRIFVSTNDGDAWTDLFNNNLITMSNNGIPWIDNHAIHWAGSVTIDPHNTNRVFVTSGNGIFMTEALSTSVKHQWAFTVKGIEETVPLDMISIPNGPAITVIGDYDGSVYHNTTTFPQLHNPQIGTTTGIDFAYANTNYVVRVGGDDKGNAFPIYYSNDKGATWTKFVNKPNNNPLLYKGKAAVSATGNAVVWGPENSSTLYRTTNNGSTWAAVTGISKTDAYPVADPVNANYFYIAHNNSVYVSSTGGASFVQKGSFPNTDLKKLRATPGFEGHLWMPTGSGGLYRSINRGDSFSKVTSVIACYAVGFGKPDEGKTYPTLFIWGEIGTVEGVFRSTDQGATWVRVTDDKQRFGEPANGKFIVGDMNTFGVVYMSTAGRGTVVGTPMGSSQCLMPFLGNAKELCETSFITLSSGILEPEYSFVWKKNAVTLPYSTHSIDVSQAGTYSVTVTKNGCEERTAQVIVSSKLLQVLSDTVCEGEHALLQIQTVGNYNWYESAGSTTAIHSGTSYSPIVTDNTVYYVEDADKLSYTIGLTSSNTSDPNAWTVGSGYDNEMYQMSLVVEKAIFFDKCAVQVMGNNTNVVCNIKNQAGTIVHQVQASGLAVGKRFLPVEFLLQPGTYIIDFVGTTGQLFNQVDRGTALFSIPNYVVYDHKNGWGWHGMMFDMQFSVGNTCARTPVGAYVKTSGCMSDVTQMITLQKGWNLFSLFVQPTQTSVESIMNGVDFSIVKNADGFYKTSFLPALQSLQSIEPGKAYLVYVNTTSAQISVSGIPLSTYSQAFTSGWNMLGVAKSSPVPLSVLPTQTEIVKDFDAFFQKNNALGLLDNLIPGKGYFIHVSAPCTMQW